MADRPPDESYSGVPVERADDLYHHSSAPSWERLPSHYDFDLDYYLGRRRHRPPFCGNSYLRRGCILDLESRNAPRHGRDNSGRRSMANTTPRATPTVTAWQASSALTDDEFRMAMTTLKKQAYAPSSSPQNQNAFRRVVSGIFRTQETANNAEEEEKACTICLETFRPGKQVVVTPCSHMFHQGCVAPWVKGHGNCPVCRFVLRNGGKAVEDDDGEDAGTG